MNPHPTSSDESDEAPEAVSYSKAKELALEYKHHETKGRQAVKKTKKKKKASSSEPLVEEEVEARTSAALLPLDILDTLQDLDSSTEDSENVEEPVKTTTTVAPVSHIRTFESVQVMNLPKELKQKSQRLNQGALDFLKRRSAPSKRRISSTEGLQSVRRHKRV